MLAPVRLAPLTAYLLAATALASGCGSGEQVAVVHFGPEAGLSLDTVVVEAVVRDGDGHDLRLDPQSYPLPRGLLGTSWPQTVAVVAAPGYVGVDVTVEALSQGVEVGRGGASLDFGSGASAAADVILRSICRGVYCEGPSACGAAGVCEPAARRLDFAVNASGAGEQRSPTVASLGDRGWVVAWVDASMLPPQVRYRRFDAAGVPLDPSDVQVAASNLEQSGPALAASPANDSFVVAWAESPAGRVWLRRYQAAGMPLGDSESPTGDGGYAETAPALGATPSSFLLAWTDTLVPAGVGTAVRFRRGNWLAGWVDPAAGYVATSPSVSEQGPAVCGSCGGADTFLVAWQDSSGADPDPSGTQVRGRWIAGTPASGGEMVLNTTIAGNQINAAAASSSALGIAAWEDRGVSPPAVRGRLCTPGSSYLAPEIPLATAGDATADAWPAVGVAGNVVLVAWQEPDPAAPASGATVIMAQRFDSSGSAIDASPFTVAALRGGTQQLPRVAGSDTAFAIVWMEYCDPALWDVRARILGVSDAP